MREQSMIRACICVRMDMHTEVQRKGIFIRLGYQERLPKRIGDLGWGVNKCCMVR